MALKSLERHIAATDSGALLGTPQEFLILLRNIKTQTTSIAGGSGRKLSGGTDPV